MLTKNRRLIAILSTAGILLLIPFIAMQFSDQVKWGVFDFIIMGGLLISTGVGCELVMRKFKKTGQRIVICSVILIALLLIWAELAVGIFGTPLAGS